MKIKEFKSCLAALDFIDKLSKKKLSNIRRLKIKLNSEIVGKKQKFTVRWKGKDND